MTDTSREGLPPGCAPVNITATGAAAAINAVLPAAAKRLNFIKGFTITGGGATAGSVIAVTVTGAIGGTLTFYVAVPTGATAQTLLHVNLPYALAATDENVAITVAVPSFGAGNTAASVVAFGYKRERP